MRLRRSDPLIATLLTLQALPAQAEIVEQEHPISHGALGQAAAAALAGSRLQTPGSRLALASEQP